MARWKHAGGPGRGFFPEEQTGIVLQNRSAGTYLKGQIAQLDETNIDALSGATFTPGGTKSVLSGVIVPTATSIAYGGTWVVAEEDILADAWGKWTLKSADVLCSIEGALATAVTDLLTVQASAVLDQNPAGSATTQLVIVARVIEAQTAGVHTAATVLTRCRFNGEGFGILTASA